jgi:hypothetical protein
MGGGMVAYIFAKKSINADRAQKVLDDKEWRKKQEKLRENEHQFRAYMLGKTGGKGGNGNGNGNGNGDDNGGAEPSREMTDPAPTRHAPEEGQLEKSKYEATEVWRSPKGDRFV